MHHMYQLGYGYSFIGILLYAAWVLAVFMLLILQVLMIAARTNQENFLWLTNDVFNLSFCPESKLLDASLTQSDQKIEWCETRFGKSTMAWEKTQLGFVFSLYIIVTMVMVTFLAHYDSDIYDFFMRKMSLRECEYVTIERRVMRLPNKKKKAGDKEGGGSGGSDSSRERDQSGAQQREDAFLEDEDEGTLTDRRIVESCPVTVEDINGVTLRHFTFQSTKKNPMIMKRDLDSRPITIAKFIWDFLDTTRYIYNHTSATFEPPPNEVVSKNTLNALHRYKQAPLSEDAATIDILYRGKNQIDVAVPWYGWYVKEECKQVILLWQLFQSMALKEKLPIIMRL